MVVIEGCEDNNTVTIHDTSATQAKAKKQPCHKNFQEQYIKEQSR